MFGITIEMLAGRYTATAYNDRDQPEWPPHPARLFSAMVATWADDESPDLAEREALCWLEAQKPPEICCGQAGRREVVTHFVPVNDATVLTRNVSRTYTTMIEAHEALQTARKDGNEKVAARASAALAKAETKARTDAARAGQSSGRESSAIMASVLQVLPEYRGKQARTYPTVLPEGPAFSFVWPHAVPSQRHQDALDRLLSRVGRLGHSSTLVACRCVDGYPDAHPKPTWVPGLSRTGTRLRVPGAGMLDALEQAYQVHHGEEPRTLPARVVAYRRPSTTNAVSRTPLLGGDWYVLGLPRRHPVTAVQVLTVTRAVRGALLAHGAQPSPEILSGHRQQVDGQSGATLPSNRPHLAVAPLLNAGHQHSDGSVFGVALVLPANCTDAERAVVEDAIRAWDAAGFELMLPGRSGAQPFPRSLEDLGIDRVGADQDWLDAALTSRRRTTTRDYWCRAAQYWVTVTPIALDRFPGNLRSRDPRAWERADAEAAASIARACVFAGLADQAEDVRVTVRLDAPLAGLPAAPGSRTHPGRHQFPSYQTGSGAPRVCVHAEISFPGPVRGPVLVGAGRYLGYGLCLPDDSKVVTS